MNAHDEAAAAERLTRLLETSPPETLLERLLLQTAALTITVKRLEARLAALEAQRGV